MKMRKVLLSGIILLFVVSMVLLTGCSGGSSGSDVKYADQDYLKSMAKGLENRWALNDRDEGKEITVAMMKEYIQTELDQVTQYESATFEDTQLQQKALEYINVLKESLEKVDYYVSNDHYEEWADVYDRRTVIIKEFVDNYGLTVNSKYQDTLDELLANGNAVSAENDKRAAFEKIIKDLNFEVKEDDGYGWKTYAAVFENTTDYDVESISLDISLLDSDGVIVSTEYASLDNVVADLSV